VHSENNPTPDSENTLEQAPSTSSEVTLKDILKIAPLFWIILVSNACYYISYVFIFSVGVSTLQKTGKRLDPETASQYFSIPTFVSLGLYPIVGFIIDKVQSHLVGALVGTCLWILGILGFLGYIYDVDIPIQLTLVVLGAGYTVYANSIYSYFPLIVENKILTTSYALISTAVFSSSAALLQILIKIRELPEVIGSFKEESIPVFMELGFSICTLFFFNWNDYLGENDT